MLGRRKRRTFRALLQLRRIRAGEVIGAEIRQVIGGGRGAAFELFKQRLSPFHDAGPVGRIDGSAVPRRIAGQELSLAMLAGDGAPQQFDANQQSSPADRAFLHIQRRSIHDVVPWFPA